MRIYLVPVEHEEAHERFLEKWQRQEGRPSNGRIVYVTPDELKAVLSTTVVDIPSPTEPL